MESPEAEDPGSAGIASSASTPSHAHVHAHAHGSEPQVTCKKADAKFYAQVLVIFTILIVSSINLSLQNGNTHLWTALISASFGALLPAPKLTKNLNI